MSALADKEILPPDGDFLVLVNPFTGGCVYFKGEIAISRARVSEYLAVLLGLGISLEVVLGFELYFRPKLQEQEEQQATA